MNKNNVECWSGHKKERFEQDFPISKSNGKASASVVKQVHDFDNKYILTISCNSGFYGNEWVVDSDCKLYMTF